MQITMEYNAAQFTVKFDWNRNHISNPDKYILEDNN
jgi:hypothetical protein